MIFSHKDQNRFFICNGISGATAIVFAALLFTNALSYKQAEEPKKLSVLEQCILEDTLNERFPVERNGIISPLPFANTPLDLPVSTESVMLIDAATGNILYEKNADMEIPPASMTKLVEMYVVFQAVEEGKVSLDDVVPLPPQCWAINMPRDASLMFLAEGQTVTLDELLLGLSIASGNDASVAVANYIEGSMDAFVKKMNEVISSMGLTKTHFVESSGYSEFNITTAREFAQFSRIYIEKFPWALERYHSQSVIRYPLEKNLPSYQKDQGDGQAIVQYNTNKLLPILPGCDGLKTGFINESGYNLTLTACRNGQRFICVMMKGPGKNSKEGNYYRIADGTTIMESAFSIFASYIEPKDNNKYFTSILNGVDKSVELKEAYSGNFTVPRLSENTPAETAENLTREVSYQKWIRHGVNAGDTLGYVTISHGETVLNKIPLVATRTVKTGGIATRAKAIFIEKILKSFFKD